MRTSRARLAHEARGTGPHLRPPLTYAQFDDAIDRAASVLRALLGEPQGERVAVLSRNSAEMLVLHFACVRSGAIFVPLNWRLAPAEISFMLEDCEPALIVLEPMFADRSSRTPRFRGWCSTTARTGFAARMQAAPAPSVAGHAAWPWSRTRRSHSSTAPAPPASRRA